MIGASLSASSTCRLASPSSSASSSTMSSIDSSIRARRASSRLRSSTEAAAGRIRRPVIMPMSSIVSTFVGFAIASSSEPSSVKPDGHRLVALGGLGADQVDRAHVEVVDGEVDEVEAEALGDDARELVVAQDAALDEHQARRAALGARGGDGLLDGLAVGEAEVDDHFADHPRRAARCAGG